MSQKAYKQHYFDLRDKWKTRHQKQQQNLWDRHRESLEWLHHHSKQFMLGSVASVMMLASPVTGAALAQQITPKPIPTPPVEQKKLTKEQLMSELTALLPQEVIPLSGDQEAKIGSLFSEAFSMKVSAELEGKRLNRSYGLIGAEQHLMRYPGDTISSHFASAEEAASFAASGMAPGRGAWGYFAPSMEAMTQKDVEREKYYIAVQTFLSPGWNENVNELYAFFKFRKMLVVNPENGKAMVVVIGDAGPAPFTGKHLGGSPEVMRYLERVDGGAKGPVLYFMIDDPDDSIPLGPVEY